MDIDGNKLIGTLHRSGFEAYYVGGCVRDFIMKKIPEDYDICTGAPPEMIRQLFENDHKTELTGFTHGTVTVFCGGKKFEITAFRKESEYSDGRHPDNVTFDATLEDDLKRRDFTINAMAMDIDGNIFDPFSGIEDIENRKVRCVGDPTERFSEDALRIMRCLRFSSQLGFGIDSETACAVHKMRENLELISKDRVRDELVKLVCGKNCADILLGYSDVISVVIPEIIPCIGFDQRTPYHKYDVWEHIVHSVAAAPDDPPLLRVTMLLHDIGKPEMFTLDANGRGHFKNHALKSCELADRILKRLNFDKKTIHDVERLILHHSDKINDDRKIKKLISEIGEDLFFRLIEIKKADNSAKNPFVLDELKDLENIADSARRMINDGEVMHLSQLAVNGNDLKKLGFSGAGIGKVLEDILDHIIDGDLKNDRDEITAFLKK